MLIYDAAFSAVFNMLNVYVCIRALRIFLRPKQTWKWNKLFVYGLVGLINWAAFYFLQNPYVTTITILMGLLAVALLFTENSLIQCFFAAVMTVMLGRIAEDIVWRILQRINISQAEDALGTLCSSLFFMSIILTIEKVKNFNDEVEFQKKSYWNLILISIGSAALSDILVNAEFPNRYMCLTGLGMICIIDIGTFYMYEKLYETGKEKFENAMLQEQVKMYINQIAIYKNSAETVHAFQHDMKNHVSLLQNYLRRGKCGEALRYTEQLAENIIVPEQYVNSGNEAVDGILNYMLHRAKLMGCEIATNVAVPQSCFMNDFDLNIILGNLLENALEALEKEKERILNIQIRYEKNSLYIYICNSFHGQVTKRDGKLISTKTNKKKHGMGILNVKRVVEKYSGELQFSNSQEKFSVEIIIYLKHQNDM